MASSSAPKKSSKRALIVTEQSPQLSPDTMGIRFNSDEEKHRFLRLHNRAHLLTKFAHVETLEELYLYNGVNTLMTNGGLEGFLTKSAFTYPRMIVEFLCTLQSHETDPPTISFRLFNKSHSLTYQEIGEAFGWKFPTQPWAQPEDGVLMQFWADSISQSYKSEANKVWMLSHPALRYVYRLLSMTLFLRGEPSGVALGEM